MKLLSSAGPGNRGGFALIITVIILALLAGLAVAFLSTSRVERDTARGVANKVKADLVAQTAVNAAIARLIDNLSIHPDSATSWEKVNQAAGSLQYQGTTLYYRDQTPETVPAGTTSPLHAWPLISGAQSVTIPAPPQTAADRETTLRAALPVLDNTNSFDLNHARFSGDTQGWIGAPAGAASRPEFRGQWIELKDSADKLTGRYAFWIEDESFKANVNLLGNNLRGPNSLGKAPSEIPLQGLLAAIVLGGPDYTATANGVFGFRSGFPNSMFFEYRALNQVDGQSTLADSAKFEATVFSGTSNLSRSGSKRVNLNKIVADSTDGTAIRKQLDQIIKTITYHLPNFAQRLYRTGADKNSLDVPSSGSPSLQTIYLNKIAANIRDYIDTDSQPTIVSNDPPTYTVRIGSSPGDAIRSLPIGGATTSGNNEVIAIGKERVPTVQEYAFRVRQITFSARTGISADYQISIDHYIEFWNTSNRDILLSDLGPNPFVLIANQPGWNAGTMDNIPEGRDTKLFLSQATSAATHAALTSFPAGSVTVITSDPQPLSALTPDLTRVYYIPITPDIGLRTYSGRTNLKNTNNHLRLNLLTRTTTSSDYETEIALGNDLGILESAWGSGCLPSAMSINIDDSTENRFDQTKWHFEGGLLRGNVGATAPKATTGDPRTNAEQIRFDLNGASAINDKTRYRSTNLNSSTISNNTSDSTLTAPNSNFPSGSSSASVDPSLWFDYSSSTQSANAAPAVIANALFTSIGQLGDLFDPVRTRGDATGNDTDGVPLNIKLSRSGGRTLKIGQPERYNDPANPPGNPDPSQNTSGLWDGNSNSASREWTAWRLTDVFSSSDLIQLDGRININGVNRDKGVALKAALYGYIFQPTPDSDPNLAGKPFDTDPTDPSDKINELIKQMQARVTNKYDPANPSNAYGNAFANTVGPLAEHGELSEMPMFNAGTDLASTVITANTYDRGREELFRRLVELTTTRGNIFTVYAVGQSLVPQLGSNPPIVTSTSQVKVTFRIDPVWNAGTPVDPNWEPTTTTRFQKPDRYDIKILYAGE